MRPKHSRLGRYLCPVCGRLFERYMSHVRVAVPCCSNRCLGLEQRLPIADRLMARTATEPEPNGCLLWRGVRDPSGYGLLAYYDLPARKSRYLRASRCVLMVGYGAVTWEDVKQVPRWLDACHTCDNPPCVNPDHLFAAPRAMNLHDMVMKGRAARSALTDDDVRAIRRAYGPGLETQHSLARRYGVSQVSIGKIVNRVTWRHVD